ncbi:MAG TPA: carbohydrate porin, partial [Caulobacteraceae bacterium]|nr:carbohydrate porin [Caulobacteraceae bacterium]
MKRTHGTPTWRLVLWLAGALAAAPLAARADGDAVPAKDQGFAVHAQTTLIAQGAPAFRSPYRGQNSLPPSVGRETFDITFYFGLRLWRGAEIWVDPELNQGFSIGDTEGVAGFVNGEGAKLGKTHSYGRIHRWMLRQTIDLGGDVQRVDPDQDQL